MRSARKKLIAVIAVVAALALAGAGVGIWYGVTHSEPVLGAVYEPVITAEPTYTAVISWERARRADRYILEYEYASTEPGVIYTAETDSGSVSVDRRRGLMRYRLTAANDYASVTSAWMTYDVPALELGTVAPFNMRRDAPLVYSLVADSFSPVTYNYRGETYTINYYEVDVMAPGEDRDPDPVTLSLEELTGGWGFSASAEGEWSVYIRPVTYVFVNGVRVTLGRITELYSPDTVYTVVKVQVN